MYFVNRPFQQPKKGLSAQSSHLILEHDDSKFLSNNRDSSMVTIGISSKFPDSGPGEVDKLSRNNLIPRSLYHQKRLGYGSFSFVSCLTVFSGSLVRDILFKGFLALEL